MNNHIFVLSSSLDRLREFVKYYNIYNDETQTQIHFIIDDRMVKCDNFENELGNFNIHYVSDVINGTLPLLETPEICEEILQKYGVSIKWLIFLYAHRILGLQKVMMMDDDTFLLQPIDHYFKHDYVFYREFLSAMSKKVLNGLSNVFGEVLDVHALNEERCFLNSGQIIHTDNEHLLKFINLAFSQKMLDLVNEAIGFYQNKDGSKNSTRPFGGTFWTIEQYVYAVYYKWLSLNSVEVHTFKPSEMRLQTTIIPESLDLSNARKLPKFIHYLPRDKSPLYNVYARELARIISGEIEVKR